MIGTSLSDARAEAGRLAPDKGSTNAFKLDVEVPVGRTATVYMPASKSEEVTESGKKIKMTTLFDFEKMENGYAIF